MTMTAGTVPGSGGRCPATHFRPKQKDPSLVTCDLIYQPLVAWHSRFSRRLRIEDAGSPGYPGVWVACDHF
jgi:hypothetical protein